MIIEEGRSGNKGGREGGKELIIQEGGRDVVIEEGNT